MVAEGVCRCINVHIVKKYFQSKRRQQKTSTQLFHEYVWKRQTYTDLGEEHARSAKWVQRTLDEVSVKKVVVASARRVTLVLDATFFSRSFGTLVFREAWTKKNLWWKHIESEKREHYQHGKKHLEVNGFTIQAVVIDGRRGVKQLFRDIPVQMCHFHQAQIVQRYITKNPKLKASKELKKIVETLTSTNEYTFSKNLIKWHETWKEFLKRKNHTSFDRTVVIYTQKSSFCIQKPQYKSSIFIYLPKIS